MNNQAGFERQRLFAERMADAHGVEVLRQIASHYREPEVVAGFYCAVFQTLFEHGFDRSYQRARRRDPEGWLQSLTQHLLDDHGGTDLPRILVETDLTEALSQGADQIQCVPTSLTVRNLQGIRAAQARARANLHHKGPFWLKVAIAATVLFGLAAVIYGTYGYVHHLGVMAQAATMAH